MTEKNIKNHGEQKRTKKIGIIPTQKTPQQRGMTLLELMVGMAIGLLVVAVAMGALMVSRGISGTVSDASDIQQQAAYAMRVIGTQLRQAGSLRLNLDPASAAAAAGASDIHMIEVAFETKAPATGTAKAFDPAEDTISGGPKNITVGYRRYQEPVSTASAPQSLLRNCLGGPAENSSDQRFESIFAFNASANTLTCSGNDLPAQPIVQNVANFQLRYFLQDNSSSTDGSRIRMVTEVTPENRRMIQAVEVCLVLYGSEPIDMPTDSPNTTSYIDCATDAAGTPSLVNMAALSGSRARRMHLVFRNVFQLRSQGLI
jgi:type IV pilus assembly protein PilW